MPHEIEDLLGTQVVYPGDPLGHIAPHRVGLAGSRLSVGKTGDLGPSKGVFDQRSDRLLINFLVGRPLVVRKIEIELGFLQVFGEIDLLPEFERYLTYTS